MGSPQPQEKLKLASKNDALAQTGGRSPYDIRRELATTGANLYGVNAIFLVSGSSEHMEVVASPQIPFGADVSNTSRSWLLDVDVARMGVAEVHISDVYVDELSPARSLASSDVPCLVIHGEHDFIPVLCAAHITQAIPGARLVVLAECGHFSYLECPQKVHTEIADFIANHSARNVESG